MPVHTFFKFRGKRGDLLRVPLDLQLHPSVRQIADTTGDLEFLCDLKRRVTETDALHASCEMNILVMDPEHKKVAPPKTTATCRAMEESVPAAATEMFPPDKNTESWDTRIFENNTRGVRSALFRSFTTNSRRPRAPFSVFHSAHIPFHSIPMRLATVARNTFTEALRQKLFALLLILALALAASSQFFRDFNFGSSELKFIADFGFGAIVFFGSALTITATAQLFFSEIENRTALTLLAKPIRRSEFIVGKFLGITAVIALFCILTTLLLAALLYHRETALMTAHPDAFAGERLISYPAILAAGLLQWLKFTVLAAITLLVASYSNTNLYTVIVAFFILLICHLQYLARDAYAHIANPVLQFLTRALGYIFPNFQLYNITDHIALHSALPARLIATAILTALVYNIVILALATLTFRGREI